MLSSPPHHCMRYLISHSPSAKNFRELLTSPRTMYKILDREYEENILHGSPSWNLKANFGFKYKV